MKVLRILPTLLNMRSGLFIVIVSIVTSFVTLQEGQQLA